MAEALNRMVQALASTNLLRGLKVCESAPPISILEFANDTIIFCEASEDKIKNAASKQCRD